MHTEMPSSAIFTTTVLCALTLEFVVRWCLTLL